MTLQETVDEEIKNSKTRFYIFPSGESILNIFSNLNREIHQCSEKNCEDWMNISDYRAFKLICKKEQDQPS